jgi:hypothetical protein
MDNRRFFFALDSIIPSYLSFYFRLFGAKNLDQQEALDRFNKLSKVFTHRMECHACGKNLALYFDFDTMTLKPVSEESCIFNSICDSLPALSGEASCFIAVARMS